MMDDYLGHRRHGRNYMRLDSQVIDPPGHATDLFTQWSVDYIRQRASNPTPFLLYLAYNAPHFPVQPPAEWVERVKARLPGIGPKRAALIALIEHMDHGIGQVVSALKAAGRYDNTLIIFTGDNGGNLDDSADNRPLRNGKQSMYEGGLRVPTTVSWPAVIKAGSSTDIPCMTMDILPTLIDITGKGRGGVMDGRSLLPLLKGDSTTPPERPMYFVRREGGMRHGGSAYHALRLGDWKMLRNTPYEPWQLYNLREDPAEKTDRASTNPAVLQQLNSVLMSYIQEGGRTPWQRPVK
jgi:arylsulfatase A-like enzyme